MKSSRISRRQFLAALTAAPLAAGFGRGFALQRLSRPRVIVVGAGAFGGWSAFHLQRLGAEVTLIDAWGPGNPRSSSGGETRVIRAVYGADRIYVEMVKRSYELWEQLDSARAEPLYVETGVLWMHRGDDQYVRSSLPALRDLSFPLDQLAVADAARQYPQIRFDGVKSVWMERRAGVLSARSATIAVRDAFVAAGGKYATGRIEPGPIREGRLSSLRQSDGTRLEADAYVFACGPWIGQLFPDVIGSAVQATRQEVYYFGTPAGSERYRPARFPIWIDFGERIFYGIPDVHGRGVKIADDTRGDPFDPTTGDRTASGEGIERSRKVLGERFPELARAPLIHAEVCQYENSPDGHLIADRHPGASNVWLAGGGSGHGFKLSPALGEMVAAGVWSNQKTPEMFGLARLRDLASRATQFDRKK